MANVEEFILKLTQQISGPAGAASGALARLEAQIQREQQALGGLDAKFVATTKRLREAQQGFGGRVDISAVRKQQDALRAIQEQQARVGGALGKLQSTRGLAAQADAMREAESSAAKMSVALSQAAGGAARIVVAMLAVAAAIIAAGAAFVYFAVKAADAARSMRLLNEASAGGSVAGAELSAVITDVANRVPLARDRIGEMARGLELAKFKGREMQLVLQAMAVTASAVGDGAAAKIQQIAESSRAARRFLLGTRDIYGEFTALAGTGLKNADIYAALAKSMKISIGQAQAMLLAGRVSVRQGIEALDAAVQTRFGKTVAAQMLALSTQFTKFKENVGAIFAGLDLEPFLKGLKSISDVFSQTTVTGRALKFVAETALQPLINMAATAAPMVRAFMQGFIIGVLLVTLGVLKLRKAYLDAFGGETKSSIDWVKTAMYAGIGVVGALTAVVVALAAAFAILAAGALLVAAPFLLFGYLVYQVISSAVALYEKLSALDLSGAAGNMVDSFVRGITIEKVVTAMSNLGLAAKDALYRALQIRSPSKVALDAAHNVTSTFAGGVEDGTGETRAAFSGMVDPSKVGGSGAPAGRSVTIGEINYYGSREDFPDFETRIYALFEGATHEGPKLATG